MKSKRKPKPERPKCDFCDEDSRHTWAGKYGIIHACNFHWRNLNLISVMNTKRHWKEIMRKVGG